MAKVKSVKPVGIEPVYNLEVDETHCFAINGGLIVHNCESLRYGLMSRPSPAPQRTLTQNKRPAYDPFSAPKLKVVEGGYFNLRT